MGYSVEWKILNALDFGLPQRRERIFIVAMRDGQMVEWPSKKMPIASLEQILEEAPDKRHFVSDRIRRSRQASHKAAVQPSIWHENKSGNISSHSFSCALRAGASYNYLLVNGERRLTPREQFRLQGFPDSYELPDTDTIARRLSGNAVPVPMAQAVLEKAITQQQAGQNDLRKSAFAG